MTVPPRQSSCRHRPHLRGVAGRLLAALALGFGTLLWVAPGIAQSYDSGDLGSRLNRLEAQVQDLQRHLGHPVTSPGEPIAPTQAADFEIRLSQLEHSVQELVGKYDEAVFGVAQVRDRLEKLSTDLDFRLSQIESKGGSEAGLHPTTPVPSPPPPASPHAADKALEKPADTKHAEVPPAGPAAAGGGLGGVPANVEEQYNEAFGLLRKADYDQAEKALTAFVSQHHDSPLAGNAQYWLGETYYVRGKFAEAAVAFADGFQKYPKSNKAPDDLLKLGMALSSLNQKNDACKTFDQLGTLFPTAAASLKRRAEMERKKLNCS